MTHRQRAEIQLQGILNEPVEALPAFTRRASDHLQIDELSIEQVSKLLNTQPFIIERLVRALYSSTDDDEDIQTLNKIEVQRLTRVLNSTMDVRALVFFMMLDEDNDQYINQNELAHFYEEYLKNLKTFDANRLQEVIRALLNKFHLEENHRLDFEEFYSIVSKDSTLLESLSQFTVHPTWFIKSSSSNKFSQLFSEQKIYEVRPDRLKIDYIKDNLSRIIMILLYILINFALMLYVIIYRAGVLHQHVFVVIARIGGMLLNFNCALVIVLMLKHTILIIRTIKFLRKLLPVDDHIDFHKMVGRIIAALSILHTIGHMANFARSTGRNSRNSQYKSILFYSRTFMGNIYGRAKKNDLTNKKTLISIVFSLQLNRTLVGSVVLLH